MPLKNRWAERVDRGESEPRRGQDDRETRGQGQGQESTGGQTGTQERRETRRCRHADADDDAIVRGSLVTMVTCRSHGCWALSRRRCGGGGSIIDVDGGVCGAPR